MNKNKAQNIFSLMTPKRVGEYKKYWDYVTPITQDDIFRRYLFAFTSVHTSWEGNVRGYNAIKDLGWLDSKDELRERLIKSACGLFNHRTDYIWKFSKQFYSEPEKYCAVQADWQSYRNTLVNDIVGIGIAKVSFVLEMCFPNEAEVTCIDTHGIQLYDLDKPSFKSKKEVKLYEDVEKHWIELSKDADCPAYIARCLYWDYIQKQNDSRYWSFVLEDVL